MLIDLAGKMSTGQHNVYYVNMQKAYTTMTEGTDHYPD